MLGGTFNPIHRGHLHLAREFCKRLELSRVILIPTQSPPHKREEMFASAQDRLAMCRLAVGNEPLLEVSDIEISRGGTSYTVDTLRALSDKLRDVRLFFIMGADMFLTLESWKEFSEIARLADLCAAARQGNDTSRLTEYAQKLESHYGARCHIESISPIDVSSTEIRGILSAGGDAGGLLPEGVFDYIRQNGLYTN